MKYKKNICHPTAGIKLLLFLLLLLPAMVQAQSDTTILADSLPPEITEAPAEEPQTVEVSTVDNERNDFKTYIASSHKTYHALIKINTFEECNEIEVQSPLKNDTQEHICLNNKSMEEKQSDN